MTDHQDQPSMSREPDVVDEMAAAQGWAKHMRVMTPEQRERMASLEFPRVDEPHCVLVEATTTDSSDAEASHENKG